MVDPKDIAVLTPYNAQAAAISKGLRQRGVIGVTVTSITKSQGEADSKEAGSFVWESAEGLVGKCKFIYRSLLSSQEASGAMY